MIAATIFFQLGSLLPAPATESSFGCHALLFLCDMRLIIALPSCYMCETFHLPLSAVLATVHIYSCMFCWCHKVSLEITSVKIAYLCDGKRGRNVNTTPFLCTTTCNLDNLVTLKQLTHSVTSLRTLQYLHIFLQEVC
jgi:hypothetical protein